MGEKTIKTENLIHKLSTDLRPIQTSSWIKIKLLSLFFISAFTSVVIAIFLPPSGNYIFELKSLLFLSINLIPVLLILFGIKFIHHLYDFGQTEKNVLKDKWTYITLLTFLLINTLLESLGNLQKGTNFELRPVDWYCFSMALMTATPLFIALNLLDYKFPRLKKNKILPHMAIGLSVGILVDHIHCPVTSNGHQMIGHTVLPLVGAIILSFIISKISMLIQRKLFLRKYKNITLHL